MLSSHGIHGVLGKWCRRLSVVVIGCLQYNADSAGIYRYLITCLQKRERQLILIVDAIENSELLAY